MKAITHATVACCASLFLCHCSNQAGTATAGPSGAVTGPFDSRGNYIEDWADSPEKWKRSSAPAAPARPSAPLAQNESSAPRTSLFGRRQAPSEPIITDPLPPPDVTPLPQPNIARRAPAPPASTVRPTASSVANRQEPISTTRSKQQQLERKPLVAAKPKPKVAAKPKPKPKVAAKPKPKPRPVVVKPKVMPKPAPMRYTVKKGDTLSSIASRNNTTVRAIQEANGLSGSLIRIGQTIKIPRR